MKNDSLKSNVAYQVGAFIISAIFALLIIGVYFLFELYLNQYLDIQGKWSGIIVSAVALIVLIPIREAFTRIWESKVLGRDFRLETNLAFLLKLLGRQGEVKDLIYDIFPKIIMRFKLRNALFGIINEKRKFFELYYFHQSKVKKVPRVKIKSNDILIKSLQTSLVDTGVIAGDLDIRGIRNRLLELNSHYYASLPYRGKLIGFWSFPVPIRKREHQDLIKLFSMKAALMIYNEKLKPSVNQNVLIQQEFLVAEKIQSFLKSTPIPELTNYDIKLYTETTAYLEFIDKDEYVYIRNLGTWPSGIFLSSTMGLIQAYKELNKKNIVKFLYQNLSNDFRDISGLVFISAKMFLENEKNYCIMNHYGDGFQIKSDKNKISVDKLEQNAMVDLGNEIIFQCSGKPFLKYSKKN
jgi:hypothetical protein